MQKYGPSFGQRTREKSFLLVLINKNIYIYTSTKTLLLANMENIELMKHMVYGRTYLTTLAENQREVSKD